MSTYNIGFYEDLTKIIFELSSNTRLISSAVFCYETQMQYEPCGIKAAVLRADHDVTDIAGPTRRAIHLYPVCDVISTAFVGRWRP